MPRFVSIFIWVSLVLACTTLQETEDQHFEREYLGSEDTPLHGFGISYEQMGTLVFGQSILIGMRDERCLRYVIRGRFEQIKMGAQPCNLQCRAIRTHTLHQRTVELPYHSIFRGVGYDFLHASPFLNADLHIIVGTVSISIPLWQVDVIIPIGGAPPVPNLTVE